MSKITWEDKVPAVGDDPSAWTPEMKVSASDMNSVKDSVNTIYDKIPYKSFVGRFEFTGGSSPNIYSLAKIHSNLGEFSISTSDAQPGKFTIQSVDETLLDGKTVVFIGGERNGFQIVLDYPVGQYIFGTTYDLEGQLLTFPSLDNSIEIRVYD